MAEHELAFIPRRYKATFRFHFSKIWRVFTLLVYFFVLALGSPISVKAATSITFTGEELLGKPTDTSITINIVPASTIEYHYQYGTTSGVYIGLTSNQTATGGQPNEVVINGLSSNTQYFYRMQYHLPGETDWVNRTEHSFWTQRDEGSTFMFTVTSDSHANFNSSEQNAMTNILNEHPDFEVDLGDTFMIDNTSSQTAVNNAYLAFREPLYFDKIGNSVPIFLSSGNHENEEGWNFDDTPFSIALGSVLARKLYYPTPITDGFYSGNDDPLAAINAATYGDQYREDYYAWTWGDALFIVIDEFQYTMSNPYGSTAGEGGDDPATGDQWNWTLGQQQYDWLKQTLEGSDAKYKFVFSHNMVGGIPRSISVNPAGYVRGGAEAAGYFEWGGNNADGSWGFDTKRPGMDVPIHQLFMDNGVSAYFHGHDHQYVYETRDGIVYQEVPSPGMSGSGFGGIYTTGDHGDYNTVKMLGGPGHLRITVTSTQATVDYISSSSTSGTVNYSYNIAPNVTGPTHVLTTAVNPGGGGTISPSAGPHTYGEGAVVSVTAIANSGYTFSSWSGNCSGSGSCSVTMDADKTVTANFTALPTYVLTTAINPTGGGTISPAAGPHTYNEGVVVPVTAIASSGYTFTNWSGACSGSGTCSVTMNADKNVTANFTALPTYVLTTAINPTGGGTISPAAGPHTYNEGVVVPVTAIASSGYTFTNWSGACSGSGTCSVTMNADKSVTANFTTGNGILGDVNGDDNLNSTDALIILSGDVGIDISQFCPINCGDVNADGLVNSTDALIILSYDVGITVPYPMGTSSCPSSVTCAGCNP
jgi:hypothetical protein